MKKKKRMWYLNKPAYLCRGGASSLKVFRVSSPQDTWGCIVLECGGDRLCPDDLSDVLGMDKPETLFFFKNFFLGGWRLVFYWKKWPRVPAFEGNTLSIKCHSYPTNIFSSSWDPALNICFRPRCELSKLELWVYFNYQTTKCNFTRKKKLACFASLYGNLSR